MHFPFGCEPFSAAHASAVSQRDALAAEIDAKSKSILNSPPTEIHFIDKDALIIVSVEHNKRRRQRVRVAVPQQQQFQLPLVTIDVVPRTTSPVVQVAQQMEWPPIIALKPTAVVFPQSPPLVSVKDEQSVMTTLPSKAVLVLDGHHTTQTPDYIVDIFPDSPQTQTHAAYFLTPASSIIPTTLLQRREEILPTDTATTTTTKGDIDSILLQLAKTHKMASAFSAHLAAERSRIYLQSSS